MRRVMSAAKYTAIVLLAEVVYSVVYITGPKRAKRVADRILCLTGL